MIQPNSKFPSSRAEPIVIVSGLPRSGTSLMMAMLEAGGMQLLVDGQRKPDEDNPRGYYEYEPVKGLREGHTEWLYDGKGKAVKIISELLFHLPQDLSYQVLLMERSYDEILASQRDMLIRRGHKPDEIDNDKINSILRTHMQRAKVWIQSRADIQSMRVNFNQLIADPRLELRRITPFLGRRLNVSSMVEVVDPTLYRHRASGGHISEA